VVGFRELIREVRRERIHQQASQGPNLRLSAFIGGSIIFVEFFDM
jgi:hypothetical protein